MESDVSHFVNTHFVSLGKHSRSDQIVLDRSNQLGT